MVEHVHPDAGAQPACQPPLEVMAKPDGGDEDQEGLQGVRTSQFRDAMEQRLLDDPWIRVDLYLHDTSRGTAVAGETTLPPP
jgi:hypothetical protein